MSLVTGSALVLLVVVQSAAGALWWARLRPRSTVVEVLGMGIALGTAISLLAGLAGLLLPLPPTARPWLTLVPAAATLVWWLARRPAWQMRRSSAPEWVAVIVGFVLGGVALTINASHYPLAWTGTTSRFHPDMLFFEALAHGTPTWGPGDSVLMAGAEIRYHWFAYAWAGQLESITGAASFVTLTRVLPAVTLVGISLVAAAWAWRATRSSWAPTLAVLLVVTAGYVGATYGTVLNFDSPSQALSALWLLAWSLVALRWLRRPSWALAVLLGLLAFTLTGAKVSAAAVAAGAAVVLMLVALVRRGVSPRSRALALGALTVVPLGLGYLLLLSGSAEQGGLKLFAILDRASSVQGLNPVNTPLGILAGTVILLMAMAPRWAGVAWLSAAPSSRWQPSSVLGAGFLVTSVVTVIAFSGGLNDTWFALSASAPLAVLSAIGVARAVQAVQPRPDGRTPRSGVPPLVWAGLASGVTIALIVTLVWATGPSPASWRWLGPVVGVLLAAFVATLLARLPGLRGSLRIRWGVSLIVVLVMMAVPARFLGVIGDALDRGPGQTLGSDTFSPFVPFVPSLDQGLVVSMTADQAAAGAWLRRQDPEGLVATSVTFSPFVAALTGLKTWVSGIKYQAPYGRPDSAAELLAREEATYAFVNGPAPLSVGPLCSAGVGWVWVDPERTEVTSWEPYGRIELAGEGVTLLRLECP